MADTVAKQLEDALAKIADLEKTAASVQKELDSVKAAHVATQNELATAKAEAEKAASERVAEKAASDKAIEAEKAEHAKTQAALKDAQAKLENPAFLSAAAAGQNKPTAEGGTPPNEEPMTAADALAAYKAIDGGTIEGAKARAAFRAEHKELLGL